jgi:hypothetical protein
MTKKQIEKLSKEYTTKDYEYLTGEPIDFSSYKHAYKLGYKDEQIELARKLVWKKNS